MDPYQFADTPNKKPSGRKKAVIAVIAAVLAVFLLPAVIFLVLSFMVMPIKDRSIAADLESYHKAEVVINDMAYINDKHREAGFNADEAAGHDIIFYITYASEAEYMNMTSGKADENRPTGSDVLNDRFEVTAKNAEILKENGFFSDYVVDGTVTITATHYIYGDADHFFIASVVYNGKEYLQFEKGYNNVVKSIR